MSGTIDEGDVTTEVVGYSGGGIDEGIGMGGSAGGVHWVGGAWNDWRGIIGLGRLFFFAILHIGQSSRRGSLVDFGIGISEFDGDIADHFVLETDGLYSRDGFDYGGFSVGYVTDGSNVDGCLA